MANVDRPYGFNLHKCEGKSIFVTPYSKTVGAANYPGDLVKLDAAGTVSKYVQGDGKPLGVCVEFRSSTATDILVYDDPSAVYTVQMTTFADADAGQNSDIHATDTPDTDLNQSGQELDAAQNAATAALPIKLLSRKQGQDAGAFCNVLCKINGSVKAGGDGSTGV